MADYKIETFNAVHSLVGGGITGGDDSNTYVYHDGQTPPTQSEIDAEVIRLQAEYDAQEYARNRATEYPAMGDQLDYIFHNGIAKWKTDMIAPVKAKYPKPS